MTDARPAAWPVGGACTRLAAHGDQEAASMRIGVASGLVAPGLLRSRLIGYAGDTTAPAGSTFRSEETGP